VWEYSLFNETFFEYSTTGFDTEIFDFTFSQKSLIAKTYETDENIRDNTVYRKLTLSLSLSLFLILLTRGKTNEDGQSKISLAKGDYMIFQPDPTWVASIPFS
jgi:hypothetical protein